MNPKDRNNVLNNNSQLNTGSFGSDAKNIRGRIEETKARSFQNNNVNQEDILSSKAPDISDSLEGGTKTPSGNIKNAIGNTALNMGTNALRSLDDGENGVGNALANTVDGARGAMNTAKGLKALGSKIFAKKAAESAAAASTAAAGAAGISLGPVIAIIAAIVFIFVFIIILLSQPTIFQTIKSSLGDYNSLTDEEIYEYYNETWEEGMSKGEVAGIFTNDCNATTWQKIKSFFNSEDLTNPTELCLYLKKKVESYDKNGTTMSPGYPINALYYMYDTSPLDENGNPVIKTIEKESEERDNKYINNTEIDIISNLYSLNYIDKSDVNSLFDNYIIDDNYTYYTLHIEYNEDSTEKSRSCDPTNVQVYEISDYKLKLFLRYGNDLTDKYQKELMEKKAYDSTNSSYCKEQMGLNNPNMSKYDNVANTQDIEDKTLPKIDNYSYMDGFIFTKYPKFEDNYYDYLIAKDIELIISYIESRQDYTNYILGYPNKVQTSIASLLGTSSKNCTYDLGGINLSNLKVRLTYGGYNYSSLGDFEKHGEIEGQELVDFEKYILGVVYAENFTNEKALQAQAIAARTYILYHILDGRFKLTEENGQQIVTISNTTEDQTYCDPDVGCERYQDETYKGNITILTKGTGRATGSPISSQGGIPEDSATRVAVSQVSGMYLSDSTGKPINASYVSTTQNTWTEMGKNSKYDVIDLLNKTYSNAVLRTSVCTFNASGEWSTWKQYASDWGSILLGSSSSSSLRNVGCFMTSFAMVIAKSAPTIQIPNFDPGAFATVLKQNGQFTSGGGLISYQTAISLAVGNSNFEANTQYLSGSYSQKISTILNELNNGYDVILRVKSSASASRHGGSDQHWVVVTGIDGNNIYMADPASDETIVLNKYYEEGLISYVRIRFN